MKPTNSCHYLRAGTETKTLVLIHGFGDTSRIWTPLFETFAQDYTIIAPDMPGLGKSSIPVNALGRELLGFVWGIAAKRINGQLLLTGIGGSN
jgi:pimeloyl-ACP methyl ester carboxylesterase